jgi:hypothetical protein
LLTIITVKHYWVPAAIIVSRCVPLNVLCDLLLSYCGIFIDWDDSRLVTIIDGNERVWWCRFALVLFNGRAGAVTFRYWCLAWCGLGVSVPSNWRLTTRALRDLLRILRCVLAFQTDWRSCDGRCATDQANRYGAGGILANGGDLLVCVLC